jgi:hypothetical protein
MQLPVVTQAIFNENNEYFLVEIRADGKVSLKRKTKGWGDTWSLPLDEDNLK